MADVITGRLVLHPIARVEAARIVAGAPAPEDRWHPEYPFADELRPLRGLVDGRDTHPVLGLFQVRLRDDGTAIGGIGFHGPPDGAGAVEIGYGFVPAVRRRGYATEAARAIVRLAFEHGATVVRADTDAGNVPSQRVLLRSGFAVVDRRDGMVLFEQRGP